MLPIDPAEILAAGSIVDVAITPAQAEAIAAATLQYEKPHTPCRGLHSWRIPPREDSFTGLNAPGTGPVEVHFHYLREQEHGVDNNTPGLEVTLFAPDGAVTDSQDYG